MTTDNLASLKDDMIAFIEGHGMRHFPALISEDTPRIWWEDAGPLGVEPSGSSSSESWKDFVEMAKAVGAPMVCIGEDRLDKMTLEILSSELQEMAGSASIDAELEKLDRLYLEIGKLGHIELAFAHQGILFVHETATEWYRGYREMVDAIEDLQDLVGDVYEDEDEEQG